MRKRILATVVTAVSMGANAGSFLTGNALYGHMTSTDTYNNAAATGYVTGVSDSLDLAKLLCTPVGVSVSQSRDVVRAFLEKHPGRRHEDAADLVYEALAEHWSCRKGASQ